MNLYKISLYSMSVLYMFAGLNHFWHTEFYMRIMPPYIPMHLELVYLSGIFEVLFGFLLLFSKTRKLAAWGIVLLLIAVFPANLYHLTSGGAGMGIPNWALVLRLPLQLVLICWAYSFTRSSK